MPDANSRDRDWHDAMLRRPALSAAACFIGGVFAHAYVPALPIAWAVVTAILAMVASACVRRGGCNAVLAAGLVSAGICVAQIEETAFPADHVAHFTSPEACLANVELTIDSPPRILRREFSGMPVRERQTTAGRVTAVLTTSGWQRSSGNITLSIDRPDPRLHAGQRVRVLGWLSRPSGPENPGQFDWASYYRQQRVLVSMRVERPENVDIVVDAPAPFLTRMRIGAREVLARGFARSRALDHALLRALVLGDGDPMLRDVQDQFIRTGTAHHLAISGTHIAIIGALIYVVAKALRMRPRRALVLALGIVLTYGMVALPNPPVVRSLLLCAAFSVGLFARRSVDGVQLLSASVIAMLAYHPLDLYDAGFQLSFGTVLGLMLLTRPLSDFRRSLRDPHVVVARQVRPLRGFRLWWEGFCESRVREVEAALVASVVAAPLIAYHFAQANPWSIIASLVMIVPVLLALVAGLLKIVLTLAAPWWASAWAACAGVAVAGMRHTVEWLATFPGTDVPLRRPGVWMLVVYYALLAVPLVVLRREKRSLPTQAIEPDLSENPLFDRPRLTLRNAARWACPLLGMLLVFVVPSLRARDGEGELRVTVLSVGAGQCAVAHLPDGRAIIFDAGSMSGDAFHQTIGPYLRWAGVRRVDAMFLSHANTDHYNAAAELAAEYPCDVWVSEYFEPTARQGPVGSAAADTLSHAGRLKVTHVGDTLDLGDGVTVQVLWPPAGREDLSSNDSAQIVRLCWAGRSILFTGDIQVAGQMGLLEQSPDAHADVVLAPHHGSFEPSTPAFLEAVKPEAIVASNDRTLTKKQRDFDRAAADLPLYRTHKLGALTIVIPVQGPLRIDTFKPR